MGAPRRFGRRHRAAPPATATAIQSLARPEQQQALDALSRSPGTQRALWKLGNGIGDGIVGELVAEVGLGPPADLAPGAPGADTQPTSPTSAPATGPATTSTGSAQIGRLSQTLSDNLDASLHRAVATAFGPETQEKVRQLAEAGSDGAMRGIAQGFHEQLGPELGQAIRQQIGPALAEAIRKDVAPAIGAMLKEQVAGGMREVGSQTMNGVLGNSQPAEMPTKVRDLAKAGTLGVHDGLAQFERPDPLEALSKTLTRISWIALVVVIVAGVLGSALAVSVAALALAIWRGRVQIPEVKPGT